MQKHIKVYREFYRIGEDDIILCHCGAVSVDIHHIFSRGLKFFFHNGCGYDINDILNLIGLCRDCHNKAHGGKLTREYLLKINEKCILQWSKSR